MGSVLLGAPRKQQILKLAGVSIMRAGTGVPCPYNCEIGGLLFVTGCVAHADRANFVVEGASGRLDYKSGHGCPVPLQLRNGLGSTGPG